MAGRPFIVLGDTTTHGGTVITAFGEGRWTIDGKPVACVGDKVSCPQCKGVHTIIEGASDPDTTLDGRKVARHGDTVSCGAKLVSKGQSRATHSADADKVYPLMAKLDDVSGPGNTHPIQPTAPSGELPSNTAAGKSLTTAQIIADAEKKPLSEAPATIDLANMNPRFQQHWKDTFKGKTPKEQGGTLIGNSDGSLMMQEAPGGTEKNISMPATYDSTQDYLGPSHTHPSKGSLSGGDTAELINTPQMNIILAQGEEDQFMFLKTADTPSSVDRNALSTATKNRVDDLVLKEGMDFKEATKTAAKENAKKYGLAYYEGKGGVLHRVYP